MGAGEGKGAGSRQDSFGSSSRFPKGVRQMKARDVVDVIQIHFEPSDDIRLEDLEKLFKMLKEFVK